jgi:predicted TIM-barrel fold metal-dependent hydrolase
MKALVKRHPKTTIIWAHIGLGRIVHPIGVRPAGSERSSTHIGAVEEMLTDPALANLYFDISWDEVAKYIVSSSQAVERTSAIFNKYPNRFLFGTDVVAPPDQKFYMAVYEMYAPLWKALTPEASEKIRKGNYIRLFDEARKNVRAWEKANIVNR